MEKASLFYAILSKYKYLITIVLGLFVVCFADSNSFYRRMVLHYEIMELKSEIEYYNNVYIDSISIDTQDTFVNSGPSEKPKYTKILEGNNKTYV